TTTIGATHPEPSASTTTTRGSKAPTGTTVTTKPAPTTTTTTTPRTVPTLATQPSRLAYIDHDDSGKSRLALLDWATGTTKRIGPGCSRPTWSSDGHQVAVSDSDGVIYFDNVDTGASTEWRNYVDSFTGTRPVGTDPLFSPDGAWLAYTGPYDYSVGYSVNIT